MSPVLNGFLGSLLAGAMTAVGALPVFFGRAVPQRANDTLLGFADQTTTWRRQTYRGRRRLLYTIVARRTAGAADGVTP